MDSKSKFLVSIHSLDFLQPSETQHLLAACFKGQWPRFASAKRWLAHVSTVIIIIGLILSQLDHACNKF